MLSEIYQYAWAMGLKTTYYLRTMGASRVEKATVDMQKFGGTSKNDTSVSSTPGSIPSTIMVEETVTVTTLSSAPAQSIPSPLLMSTTSGYLSMTSAQKSQTAEVVLQEPVRADIAFDLPKNKVEIVGEVCESCSA